VKSVRIEAANPLAINDEFAPPALRTGIITRTSARL